MEHTDISMISVLMHLLSCILKIFSSFSHKLYSCIVTLFIQKRSQDWSVEMMIWWAPVNWDPWWSQFGCLSLTSHISSLQLTPVDWDQRKVITESNIWALWSWDDSSGMKPSFTSCPSSTHVSWKLLQLHLLEIMVMFRYKIIVSAFSGSTGRGVVLIADKSNYDIERILWHNQYSITGLIQCT